ncbi:MFS transporter [Dongia soli]|uniref:MFS transporter n=1 Tax=Dongia soli TaxID=600628 RepID=A0ABU5EBV8_9PROT|nr:MFS transporter [Dongia soli]MDY0883831.1 MFS transporter [Dongia soli]
MADTAFNANPPLRWSTTWGLTAGVCAVGSEALLLSPVLADIGRDFALRPAQTGFAVTIYGIALAAVAPFAGLISDRLSRKRALRLGLIIFSCAGFVAAFASSFEILLVARALCAVGAALFLPSSYAYVGDEVPFDRRAQVMGRVMFGWSISMVLGVPLGGLLSEIVGWRGALAALALLGLLVLAMLWRLPSRHRPNTEPGALKRLAGNLWRLICQGKILLLLTVNFLNMFSFYGVYTYLGTDLRGALQTGGGGAALYAGFYGLGFGISSINGRLADRLGKPRTLIIALLCLAVVLSSLPVAAHGAITLAIAMCIWGIFQGGVMVSLPSIVTEQSAELRGSVTALLSCTTYIGVTVGSSAMGLVFEGAGYQFVGLFCGAASLLAALLFVMRRRIADL